MTVKNVEKLEKSRVAVTVEVGAEEFEAAVAKAYAKARGKLSIPGFRPGKAPRKMIEKLYGAGVFYSDAVDIALPEAYTQAIGQSGLDVVGYPEVEIVDDKIDENGFTFKATVAVYPEVKLGEYKGLTAEKEEVKVTKTADKTSVTKNEKVTYTITVDVPTYPANATDRTFSVSDLLPDGLTLDTASINIKADGTPVNAAAYTLATTATAEYTFKLSVDNAQYTDNWTAYGGKQLVITYTATLNDDDTTEVNVQETNTVTFDYSNYPYIENSHKQKSDTVDVTTFAIKIDKYADGDTGTKLANAKFDLYRTATQEEVDGGKAVTIPHTSVNGVKLEGDLATDSNGAAQFAKYEANGTKYDYYLVETQAPAGYNILDKAIKVNFTDAEVEATAGIYTVKVPNSSGIKLPITGAAGTVIFTVIGIVLMAAAVLLLVFSRKKTKAK